MQTAAAYVRVSTTDQIEFSPDSQIKKITEYADSHRMVLPKQYIFLDEGLSGRNAQNRPAFMKMIGMARQKPRPFDVILLWKFSRFARNRQDSILYKSMLRKECGIEVISITEQLSQDPTAILIEALLEAMDEYYSVNLAQEVRRGMNEKFSRGGVVSIPPFGYKMGENKFEPDEEKAALVRKIYQDFLGGKSCRQIAAHLNEMGVRTNRGNRFESRNIEYILENPTYTGKMRRSQNGSNRAKRFYGTEQVTIVNGTHEPIIPEEMFQKAQERMRSRNKMGRSHRETSASGTDFMLRGLVRCGSCGAVLTRTEKGKALQCHKYTKGQCHDSHYVRIEQIQQMVLAKIEEDLAEEDGREEIRAELCLKDGKKKKEKVSIQWSSLIKILKSESASERQKNEILRCFVDKIVFDRKKETIQIYYYL
ncbi:MAG: recombinase family protein [Lachnospiraceae bacterium]|nr:recombinase family protein [Robinsoniella sp.]MDY3765806.1 recombinase family protein [Lachnospiraceae bacterium]